MSRLLRQGPETDDPFGESEDINPMNYIGNLSDAMLVLAVGIMLALVMAFNVQLDQSEEATDAEKRAEELQEELDSLKATADENASQVDTSQFREYGRVYMDEEGNLYVIEN